MRRAIAILVLLLPPVALLLFGWQLTANRDAVLQMQLRQLVDDRLASLDDDIHSWLMAQLSEVQPGNELADIANIKQRVPLIREVHVLSRAGQWRFPETAAKQLNNLQPETVFAAQVDEQQLQRPLPWHSRASESASLSRYADAELATPQADTRRGWLVRYQNQQLQLLRWVDGSNGDVWLFEISYPRFLAGLIGWLPDTPTGNSAAAEKFRLRDGSGRTLYEWGRLTVTDKETPQAQLALRLPLGSWHIQYFSAASQAGPALQQLKWLLLAALLALFSVLLGLWLWRQQQADLRRAEQRVSFVNQVSHELKTPLTNIRMYAELLQQRAGDNSADNRQLAVIVSESQRLSRLINNVLSFGRKQRDQLTLQPRVAVVDEVIAEVLENWHMALADAGIAVSFDGNAATPGRLDADVLEQILNNLIGNAEKYAASGRRLWITSQQTGTEVVVQVRDAGPGIPAADRQRVFEAFYRRSDSGTEGVSGTGIGLGLARDLARLHGGDLLLKANEELKTREELKADEELQPSEEGCCFELIIEVVMSELAQSRHILVAEDDLHIRNGLRELLEARATGLPRRTMASGPGRRMPRVGPIYCCWTL